MERTITLSQQIRGTRVLTMTEAEFRQFFRSFDYIAALTSGDLETALNRHYNDLFNRRKEDVTVSIDLHKVLYGQNTAYIHIDPAPGDTNSVPVGRHVGLYSELKTAVESMNSVLWA